eukprot:GILJ01011275.1.p1 GENE.GILJ01011275.1~~GILJ01011275.1.p1  ORF type:complete len:250 (-),score=8.29 GILJ01011275.1:366-1115(-)
MGSAVRKLDLSLYVNNVVRAPNESIKLLIIGGHHDGIQLDILPEENQAVCVGRSSTTDLALTNSASVSDKHLNLAYDRTSGNFTITDLDTTTGTSLLYKGCDVSQRLAGFQVVPVPDFASVRIGRVPVALFATTFRNMMLYCSQGEKRGQWLPIQSSITGIGRSSTNLITLKHPRVSNEHCRIIKRNGIWTIEDCDSITGTLLNSTVLDKYTEYFLFPGAVIRISNTDTFIVYVEPKRDKKKSSNRPCL